MWPRITHGEAEDAMNKRTFDGICSRREHAISLKHQGLTIIDIADRLGVSSKTIKRDFIDQGIETPIQQNVINLQYSWNGTGMM